MQIKKGMEEEYAKYVEVNADPYSKRVVTYGEEWANLMEERLVNGQPIQKSAEETSRIADYDGITGFMYGSAVSALSHFWEYGEALRRWSNLEIAGDEEGAKANEAGVAINPAIITITIG